MLYDVLILEGIAIFTSLLLFSLKILQWLRCDFCRDLCQTKTFYRITLKEHFSPLPRILRVQEEHLGARRKLTRKAIMNVFPHFNFISDESFCKKLNKLQKSKCAVFILSSLPQSFLSETLFSNLYRHKGCFWSWLIWLLFLSLCNLLPLLTELWHQTWRQQDTPMNGDDVNVQLTNHSYSPSLTHIL